MIVPELQTSDSASIAAAEGNYALGTGDTELAKRKYFEAGKALENESESALRAANRNFLRFLAASQYFHGGNYKIALKVVRRTEERFLDPGARALFGPFRKEVEDRADPGYLNRMREKVRTLGMKGFHADILELLKVHPYVFSRTGLAFLRAVVCEELNRYHAASLFYASALKFQPDDPTLPYLAAIYPQLLASRGRLDEAWEYVRYQLEEINHPTVQISASIVCYRKASLTTGEEETRLLEEQAKFFESAWAGYQQMPLAFQKNALLREYMSLCFGMVAFALWKRGDNHGAEKVCDTALAFNPQGDATIAEIQALLKKAQSLAPGIPEIADNLRAFNEYDRAATDRPFDVVRPAVNNRIADYLSKSSFDPFSEQQTRMDAVRKNRISQLQLL
ncbi:hypothetical protein [Fimbriiglobus ruber]|uniref:hypothetical protein n=1 Tax=Fimbriiglobus ruber TaxID=1908690 RepID=UPI000B4B9AD0|nr:hypothetical protein [Fimbriiglobus ruber]